MTDSVPRKVPKIAMSIVQLVRSGVVFTDIQLKNDAQVAFKAPRGYQRIGNNVTKEEIAEFAEFASKNWQQRMIDGQGQFDVAFNVDGDTRLRCNFFYEGSDNDLSVSIRRLSILVPSLEDLGVPPRLRGLLYQNVQGLILIVGPTGAGKTTTQVALLEDLNKSAPMHIITIEQPIEYKLTSKVSIVTQREVLQNTPSFSIAMTAAKRQRPDVIMIGEVRDKDTVSSMLEAASSGALVIAGTHAKNPEDAIESLLNYYSGSELEIKRSQLSSSLLAINSQRLLPSSDGTKNVLVYDLMVNSNVIAKSIREGSLANIGQQTDHNSVKLNDVLAMHVKSGVIEVEDAFNACRDELSLSHLIGPRPLKKPVLSGF